MAVAALGEWAVPACREDIRAAREQWQRYVAEAPEYPAGMFQGRGIVILAGGLTYMVPSWVNIHMLRRSGRQPPLTWFCQMTGMT